MTTGDLRRLLAETIEYPDCDRLAAENPDLERRVLVALGAVEPEPVCLLKDDPPSRRW